MEIFTLKSDIEKYLSASRLQGRTIGLVPTMGALHQGHVSLIETAVTDVDIVVCSIFVNPTQFTDKKDLENYPRTVEQDIEKLVASGCDVLFLPSVDEMYPPADENWCIDLGNLELILEGEFRPGHYQGVTQIVKKLFDVVKPDTAFFGQKDFQQVKVINRMVEKLEMPVKIIMCPIKREENGLAMSSRNVRLSEMEKKQALALSQALIKAKGDFGLRKVSELRDDAERFLRNSDGIDFEYFEILDAGNLGPVSQETENVVALVAAKVGETRLIDNIILK